MLHEYKAKRDFSRTAEPPPRPDSGEGPLIFVVQKHAARRLHYDFRLELDGVLKSWAVPAGPSLDPGTKRLAVMVEDHPLAYASFEGNIPKGEYGAGEVIVWDTGTYAPVEDRPLFQDRSRAEQLVRQGLAAGKLTLMLRGHKLKGSWALVRMTGGDNNWLLIKHRDDFASAGQITPGDENSVLSGRTLGGPRNPPPSRPARRPPASPAEIDGASPAPFPSSLPPMLAMPASAPFTSPGWFFEPKLDGYRIVAFVREGKVKLLSRRGFDVTDRYTHLTGPLGRQPASGLVLDGELVVVDERGRVCFQCLQQYLEMMREPAIARTELRLPTYFVFDILYLDGYNLCKATQQRRKTVLEAVLAPADTVRLVEHFEGDGRVIYEIAVSKGLEGIIAKRKDGIYEPGRRSPAWLKIKATLSDEFVIAGYSEGLGSRAGTFGALLLGHYDNLGQLIYAGHVGTGFDERSLLDLRQRLDALKIDRCPFKETPPLKGPTTWIRPELVAEVKFIQWTQDGYLRSPVFLRLREDKAPGEVSRVEAVSPPEGAATAEITGASPTKAMAEALAQLASASPDPVIELQGHRVALSNLDKELWPATESVRALTKRDLLVYLARVSPCLLSHIEDRPLTLRRYPDGIQGGRFYQKHSEQTLPHFVETVPLSEHNRVARDYLLCNNLPTLIWLGQLANIEFHTWFSRVIAGPPGGGDVPPTENTADFVASYPDFMIFDIDPYIYSGEEAAGDEPALNRVAFARTVAIARHLKDILDSVSLRAFVKTSGKTGLHVYVPILRQFDYAAVRAAAETVCRFLLGRRPNDVTLEWAVERRTGMVFLDYNQNVRGKTLASAYSPRPTPHATVSAPLLWEELDTVYPTDFTILTMPARLISIGDPWANILQAKQDLRGLLGMKP